MDSDGYTTAAEAGRILRDATRDQLFAALAHITASAISDGDSGADTAAVVYEQLGRLGIVIP